MNYAMVLKNLGNLLISEAFALIFPLIVAVIYKGDDFNSALYFSWGYRVFLYKKISILNKNPVK